MNDFAGLVAVVTGGASGIGLATANILSARGAGVAVLDLKTDGVSEPLVGVACDVRDDASVRAAVDAVVDRFGQIDVLVNNAGIGALVRSKRMMMMNGLGSSTSTSSESPGSPGRPTPPAALGGCGHRQHVLGRGDRRSAAPGSVLRVQRGGAIAHPRDGRGPYRGRHPGQLRQPGDGRHTVDRAFAVRGRRSRVRTRRVEGPPTPSPTRHRGGGGGGDRVPGQSAAGSTIGAALAVDGGMANLRLRT
jgi:hypothetical protein